ncbi:hypothetical protein GBAR_LOCUS10585, partial [Geodia barretti]
MPRTIQVTGGSGGLYLGRGRNHVCVNPLHSLELRLHT